MAWKLVWYLLLVQAQVLRGEALPLGALGVAQLGVAALVLAQRRQLLLLRHLRQRLLRRLPDQHLQDRLHFQVEVEQLQPQSSSAIKSLLIVLSYLLLD